MYDLSCEMKFPSNHITMKSKNNKTDMNRKNINWPCDLGVHQILTIWLIALLGPNFKHRFPENINKVHQPDADIFSKH